MKLRLFSLVALVIAAVASAVGTGGVASASSTPHGNSNGVLNVIDEGITWPNLDPALDPHNGTDGELLDPIYGLLFTPGPNGSFGYDLATGYTMADHNKTAYIRLRHGVTFTDGTPFDASAVAFNVNRDMTPANACTCLSFLPSLVSASVVNKYEVALHMSVPDPVIVRSIIGISPDWIISPAALASEGVTQFDQDPVGAGPYEVVSNVASSTLTLKRNPHYWQKGYPKLSEIVFTTATSDTTAYSALESGTTQMIIGLTTDSLVQSAKSQFQLVNMAPVTAVTLQLNSTKPPFNDLLAREAVTYATNPTQILDTVDPGYGTVVQGQQAPGGIFYQKHVTGYHSYNLSKAEQLVHQLGGLSMSIQYVNTSAAQQLEAEALQNQLETAGIQVSLVGESFTVSEEQLNGRLYEGLIGASGGVDPDIGQAGLEQRFTPNSMYGAVDDPTLTGLINRSAQLANSTVRAKIFTQIFDYIAKNDYVDELFATPSPILAAKNVGGLTSAYGNVYGPAELPWPDISIK